jgi:L-fucose isomerase-like protein
MSTAVLIPTARPTFDIPTAISYADAATALLSELGADVVRPDGLVMDAMLVPGAKALVDANADADLIVHVCASFADASTALELYRESERPVLLWAFREPGVPGDRLLLNSFCGANLAAHALVRAGVDVRLCYGNPDEPVVRELLASALAGELPVVPPLPGSDGERAPHDVAIAALDHLRGQRIGVLGEPPKGFTPSEFDPEVLRDLFGLEVEPLQLDAMFAEIDRVARPDRERELAAAMAWQPTLADLEQGVLDTFAAVTIALREWHDNERLAALSIRCWPEFPTELGVCPCSALSRLADEEVATQCERDVYGAATMLLMAALGSGTSYLVDTVDLVADENIVRFWHCGSAATGLAADPSDATQFTHCNRKIGVVGNFSLRPGPVIAVRLTEDPTRPGSLRMLIASGTALDRPNRFQGNTADVRLDTDATRFVESLVTGGFPHHTVLAWNDIRPGLRAVADELGIPVVEF